MTKTELNTIVAKFKEETKEALETVWADVNKGQKNKILKDEKVKKLFEKYGVNTDN